jgi:hypothetical protein
MDNVNSTGTNKEAGVLVYLVEELTDARLRCEQLKKFVSQAVRLIAMSPQRDHLYEVAGDTIYGIPDALFKLDKALGATALAASRLDYEELKTQLRPEKVEELEDVLRDVRIRQIDRRSPYIKPIPEAMKLAGTLGIRDLNELAQNLESILVEAMRLRKELPPGLLEQVVDIQNLASKSLKKIKHSSTVTSTQRKKATMFRAASSNRIATALRRIASEVEAARISPQEASLRVHRVLMALSQTSQQAIEAMGPIQASSREEVIKGFKSANPDLTDDQLEEIADQWERNKSVVKDKHADEDAKRSRFEEGKPADPTQNMTTEDAKKWKDENEKNRDNFKSAAEEGSEDPLDQYKLELDTAIFNLKLLKKKDPKQSKRLLSTILHSIGMAVAQMEEGGKGILSEIFFKAADKVITQWSASDLANYKK